MFALAALTNELLAGVVQRLGGDTRVQVERADRRFAAVTRALGWRYHRSLIVGKGVHGQTRRWGLQVSGLAVFEEADFGAAVRFLAERAPIAELRIKLTRCRPAEQAALRDVAINGLLLSPRTRLSSLLLKDSAKEVFDSGEAVVALCRRFCNSLTEVALGFRADQPEPAVYAALRACKNLRRVTVRCWHPSMEQLQLLLGGLQLQAFSIVRCKDNDGSDTEARDNYVYFCFNFASLPSPDTLTELHLRDETSSGFSIMVIEYGLTSAPVLEKLRLLSFHSCFCDPKYAADGRYDADYMYSRKHTFCSGDFKQLLAYNFPNLEAVEMCCADRGTIAELVGAFFNRHDANRSLDVKVSTFWRDKEDDGWPWLDMAVQWRAVDDRATIDCHSETVRELMQLPPPQHEAPKVPADFAGDDYEVVLVAHRTNETRRLNFWLRYCYNETEMKIEKYVSQSGSEVYDSGEC